MGKRSVIKILIIITIAFSVCYYSNNYLPNKIYALTYNDKYYSKYSSAQFNSEEILDINNTLVGNIDISTELVPYIYSVSMHDDIVIVSIGDTPVYLYSGFNFNTEERCKIKVVSTGTINLSAIREAGTMNININIK